MSGRFAVALLILAGLARAGEIHVPGDVATIQRGIDIAADGDVVLVGPGTYPEAIDFHGKDIRVVAVAGPEVTVIDATGLGTSVVSFVSGEPPTAGIEGFTITGGTGRLSTSAPGETARIGGGVACDGGAWPTISGCVIEFNTALRTYDPNPLLDVRGFGGGVGCGYGASATLIDCVLRRNTSDRGGGGAARQHDVMGGTPLSFSGTLDVQACAFLDNATGYGNGGGLYAATAVRSSRFERNFSDNVGGGLSLSDLVEDCHFEDNRATYDGAGAHLVSDEAIPLIRCTFHGNANESYLGVGGGAWVVRTATGAEDQVAARDCTFAGNVANSGDGLYMSSPYAIPIAWLIDGCSFSGDVPRAFNDELTVRNSIVWGLGPFYTPLEIETSVSYSLVQGGFPGPGNLDADPLFVDAAAGDLHLLPASPCVDAGNPSVEPGGPELDIDGEPRVQGQRVDMGADESPADCNANGIADFVDLVSGSSIDCDGDTLPDECEASVDCNGNGIFDACDIASGRSGDCDADGVPDECEFVDCNGTGLFDPCDIVLGLSQDCDGDLVPDECDFVDCNGNGVFDGCDAAAGTSPDCNGNFVPDECELVDCNGNGILDRCDITSNTSPDCNGNGVPDECDLASGTSADIDRNGVPDECHAIVHVPADAPTLQAALALAEPSDTILLAPGVYSGPGNHSLYLFEPVLVLGQGGPEACVIDCAGAGWAFSFDQLASGLIHRVRGLTVRNTSGPALIHNGTVQVEIEDCLFEGNSNLDGGALRASANGTFSFRECAFVGNEADDEGGAIFVYDDGSNGAGVLSFTDCRFEDNTAAKGGAIHVGDENEINLERCVFIGNSATSGPGGALRLRGSPASIANCTFIDNSASTPGGSIRVAQAGNLVLRNSILRGGTAPAGNEIALQSPESKAAVSYCDVQGGQAGVDASAAQLDWGPGNIDAEPLFVDGTGGDFHLLPGSPCINAGDPADPVDPDGSPADMGAFAYEPWVDLGHALAGSAGLAALEGHGALTPGAPLEIVLAQAAVLTPVSLILGLSPLEAPFKGGVLVPDPDVVFPMGTTDVSGGLSIVSTWPANAGSGATLILQAWWPDFGGPQGYAASSGLQATAP